MSEPAFDEWVILELLGHRRLAGRLTEQQIGGASFLRLDIPSDPPATQMYSASAVYCITPTTEEMARKVATLDKPQPVQRWELTAIEAPKAQECNRCGERDILNDMGWCQTCQNEDEYQDRDERQEEFAL